LIRFDDRSAARLVFVHGAGFGIVRRLPEGETITDGLAR